MAARRPPPTSSRDRLKVLRCPLCIFEAFTQHDMRQHYAEVHGTDYLSREQRKRRRDKEERRLHEDRLRQQGAGVFRRPLAPPPTPGRRGAEEDEQEYDYARLLEEHRRLAAASRQGRKKRDDRAPRPAAAGETAAAAAASASSSLSSAAGAGAAATTPRSKSGAIKKEEKTDLKPLLRRQEPPQQQQQEEKKDAHKVRRTVKKEEEEKRKRRRRTTVWSSSSSSSSSSTSSSSSSSSSSYSSSSAAASSDDDANDAGGGARGEDSAKKEKRKNKSKGKKRRKTLCRLSRHVCFACGRRFKTREGAQQHLLDAHHPSLSSAPLQFKLRQKALGAIRTYRLDLEKLGFPLESINQLFTGKDNGAEVLCYELLRMKQVGVQLSAASSFVQMDASQKHVSKRAHSIFITYRRQVHLSELNLLPRIARAMRAELDDRLMDYADAEGSGWHVEGIHAVDFVITRGAGSLDGRCGELTLPVVNSYLRKHFFNPRSSFEVVGSYGENCFYYNVAQHIFGGDFSEGTFNRQRGRLLSRDELRACIQDCAMDCSMGSPLSLGRVQAFEEANAHLQLRVNVHVFSEDRGYMSVFRVSNKPITQCQYSIDLLLLTLNKVSHYVLISDLGAVRLKRHSRKNITRQGYIKRSYTCSNCYASFSRVEALGQHEMECLNPEVNTQQCSMPPEGTKKRFQEYWKQVPVPIWAAFDFESGNRAPTPDEEVLLNTTHTSVESIQTPVSYSLVYCDRWNNILFRKKEVCAEGKIIPKFFDALQQAKAVIEPLLQRYPRHNLDGVQANRLKKGAQECYLCRQAFPYTLEEDKAVYRHLAALKRHGGDGQEEPLGGLGEAEEELLSRSDEDNAVVDDRDDMMSPEEHFDREQRRRGAQKTAEKSVKYTRVVDHCHYSGEILGVAHSGCNLQRQIRFREIIHWAHNMQNYDAHLLVRGLGQLSQAQLVKIKPSGLATNTERFRMLTLDKWRFQDSLSFLNTSLEKSTANLLDSRHGFHLLKASGLADTEEKLQLLTRKGVFPYSRLRRVEEFDTLTRLPPIEDFYNDLDERPCSPEDYRHAQRVFEVFECRNMTDYMLLYNELDVFLLLESLGQFRQIVMDNFGLDMSYFVSLPSLSYSAYLKKTGVSLGLLSDMELYRLFKSNLRGGMAYARQRRGESTSDHQMAYLDVNNLYGLMLMQPMPIGDFELIRDPAKLEAIDWTKNRHQEEVNYMLLADWHYPSKLHDRDHQLPLMAAKETVTYDDLSPYCKESLQASRGKGARHYKSEKLLMTFRDKHNILLHSSNVQLYLSEGLVIKKVHAAIKFRQSSHIREYIEICTELRKQAKNKFMKDVFKLMCNSLYGSFLLDQERFLSVKFLTSKAQAVKAFNDPRFVKTRILSEDLVLCFSKKRRITLNSFIPVGFSVLELSKTYMNKLWRDCISERVRDPVLYMSDTDSFVVGMTAPSLEEGLFGLRDTLDLSNTQPDHPWHDVKVKQVPGLLKEEGGFHHRIREGIFLKAKCYSLETVVTPPHANPSSVEGSLPTWTNKSKGVKQSVVKKLTLDDYKKGLETLGVTRKIQHRLLSKGHTILKVRDSHSVFNNFDDKFYWLDCGVHGVPYGSVRLQRPDNQVCPDCA